MLVELRRKKKMKIQNDVKNQKCYNEIQSFSLKVNGLEKSGGKNNVLVRGKNHKIKRIEIIKTIMMFFQHFTFSRKPSVSCMKLSYVCCYT